MRRREFLVSGAGAAALSLAPLAGAVAASHAAGAAGAPPARLDLATFKTLVGQPFALRDAAPAAELVLAEVRESAPADARTMEQFSLVFEHGDGRPFAARTYLLTHPALGTFALYLQPATDAAVRAEFSLLA